MDLRSVSNSILILVLILCGAVTSQSYGVVTLTVAQSGPDVKVAYDGSWDSWTRTMSMTRNYQRVSDTEVYNMVMPDAYFPGESFTVTSGTWNVSKKNATTVAGDQFGFKTGNSNSAFFYAPAGYSAGSPLTGSLTFADNDLLTMGFTPDSSGTFSGAGNTVNFTVGAIPEPNSYGFLLGAAGLATAIFFRRRRRSSAV